MPAYRSRTTTHGRNMAGARGLWRATGMKNEDFGKPIIAVVLRGCQSCAAPRVYFIRVAESTNPHPA